MNPLSDTICTISVRANFDMNLLDTGHTHGFPSNRTTSIDREGT